MYTGYRTPEPNTGTLSRYYACGTKFLRVLIFAIFAGFSAIRKKVPSCKIKLPQFFPPQIYSTVEVMYKNTGFKEKML